MYKEIEIIQLTKKGSIEVISLNRFCYGGVFFVGKNSYRLLVLSEDTNVINCLRIPKKINGLKLASESVDASLVDYQVTSSQTIESIDTSLVDYQRTSSQTIDDFIKITNLTSFA